VLESVYSAVRNDSLYKADFYNRGGKCLQRGTDDFFYIKLIFVTVLESVYSAVRTDSLYKTDFYNSGGKCLQRGTD
jgi:hypothetical protein